MFPRRGRSTAEDGRGGDTVSPRWYDAFVKPANVVLVGFMGAGKSMCGRVFARRSGRCFVETDDMIVASDGRSIPDIFRQDGEEKFRQLEAEALDALRLKTGNVIATGGGLPCREGRMETLKSLGTVVWLDGDFRDLHERASRTGDRPMLQGRSPRSRRSTASERHSTGRPISRSTRPASASTTSSTVCCAPFAIPMLPARRPARRSIDVLD